MKSTFKIFIVLLCICSSCDDVKTKQAIFSKEKVLRAEETPLKEIISPDFMIKEGKFLIISSRLTDIQIHTYSLPSLEYLGGTGNKGRGPGEIQVFPMFCRSEDDQLLYVWGYKPTTIQKWFIDQNGRFIDKGEIDLGRYDIYNDMQVISDSIFIYYLTDNLKIIKYDMKNRVFLDEIVFDKDSENRTFNQSNRGIISVNDSYLVYAYMFKKQINIYDLKTFKLKTIIKGEKKELITELADPHNIVYKYLNVVAGKDQFYVLYSGRKYGDSPNSKILEVYNYKGNPVIKYSFDKSPSSLFVVDEENSYIYSYNENYPDVFLKYKIN